MVKKRMSLSMIFVHSAFYVYPAEYVKNLQCWLHFTYCIFYSFPSVAYFSAFHFSSSSSYYRLCLKLDIGSRKCILLAR